MASKKRTPKKPASKPSVNKSDFIRAQPPSLSAAEVVKRAKAAGVSVRAGLVYEVRRVAKAKRSKSRAKAPRVTATASAARASGARGQSKAAFVRGLPASLTAKEVVAKGRAASIKLTESYVYNVRGAAKKTGGTARRGGAAGRGPSAAPAGSLESLLKAVAAEVGLGRAVEVLEAERARVRAAIRG